MAADLPISDAELRLLAALVEAKVEFMIVGLSAAALQGAPVVTEDIDLWFRNLGEPRMVRAVRRAGATYVPPMSLNPPMLVGECAQPFDLVINMSGLGDYGEEMKNSIEVKIGNIKVKVLSLERVLVSKQAANRLKDRLVIPVLRHSLATRNELPSGASISPVRKQKKATSRQRPVQSSAKKHRRR